MRALVHGLLIGCVTLTMISLCGCGNPQWLADIRRGVDKTKKECQPGDVRASVMPLFEKYGHAKEGTAIPASEIPETLYSLPIFLNAKAKEIDGFVSHKDELTFMVGSGFGHWGIVVCRDETTRVLKGVEVHRATPWADGIFFYSEYR